MTLTFGVIYTEVYVVGWLDTGDNAWQMTAATLVGLMSLPGLAVLYGGVVKRKWGVNTMMMAFSAFSLVLVIWMLYAYRLGFGDKWFGASTGFWGKPGPSLNSAGELGQGIIPQLGAVGKLAIPQSSLVYFQFVFAAITPLLFLGSVLGRMNFKAWLVFVPLWTTFAYTVNAFLIWGGGYWGAKGALDFSGGYVIHLAAGVSGFIAAAMVGPRLQEDIDNAPPNNLLMVAVGAGMLWLGWNGFNGGDPYFATPDASAAIVNTNLCTGVALLVWMFMDMTLGEEKKSTFLGIVNGMIVGLVAITPAAGFVTGYYAMAIGLIAAVIVWFAFNKLSQVGIFAKVDDALGVVYTHGIAGLTGGLLTGVFASVSYTTAFGDSNIAGAIHGDPKELAYQAGAALTVIVWDGLVTFILLKVISFFIPLRAPEADLLIGDLAFHGEQLYDFDIQAGDIAIAHSPAHVDVDHYTHPTGAVPTAGHGSD